MSESAANTEPRCPGCGRPVSECQAEDVDESPDAHTESRHAAEKALKRLTVAP